MFVKGLIAIAGAGLLGAGVYFESQSDMCPSCCNSKAKIPLASPCCTEYPKNDCCSEGETTIPSNSTANEDELPMPREVVSK